MKVLYIKKKNKSGKRKGMCLCELKGSETLDLKVEKRGEERKV